MTDLTGLTKGQQAYFETLAKIDPSPGMAEVIERAVKAARRDSEIWGLVDDYLFEPQDPEPAPQCIPVAGHKITEAMVEAAARAIRDHNWPDFEDRELYPIKDYLGDARAALQAAEEAR